MEDAYPLRTPRTKLSMKNEPTTMRGMKKAQLYTLPIASFIWKTIFNIIQGFTFEELCMTDPVHDGGPPLHGDALEHGEHGVDDVVEGGDPVVGPLPLLQAHALVRPELKVFITSLLLYSIYVYIVSKW